VINVYGPNNSNQSHASLAAAARTSAACFCNYTDSRLFLKSVVCTRLPCREFARAVGRPHGHRPRKRLACRKNSVSYLPPLKLEIKSFIRYLDIFCKPYLSCQRFSSNPRSCRIFRAKDSPRSRVPAVSFIVALSSTVFVANGRQCDSEGPHDCIGTNVACTLVGVRTSECYIVSQQCK